MRNRHILAVGKWLIKHRRLRICIIDDERVYFNEDMLEIAAAAGFAQIERHDQVTTELLSDLLKHPRDIIILDIHGVAEPSVGRDGFDVASRLYKSTKSYIAITSAHTHRLLKASTEVDYVLEERLLTAVDFIDELEVMVTDYLAKKTRFYSKLLYKLGWNLTRVSL